MSTATLQPITVNITQDQIRQSFTNIHFTDFPNPLWHFQIALPKSTRRAPALPAAPQPAGPMITLALLNRPDPPCDIEIFGQHLPYEIHPADWLDLFLQEKSLTPLSKKRLPTLGGDVGDVLAKWSADNQPFLGRLFALKAGPRLILIWFRAAEADYPHLADPIFLSLSSFQFLDNSPGPLAEKIKWLSAPLPIPWKIALPISWQLTEEPATKEAASFQATLPGNPPANMLAKLSAAIIAPNQITDPTQAFQKMHESLQAAGITTIPTTITPISAQAPYTQAWRSQSQATVNSHPAALHLRLLRHPKAWLSLLALTPPLAASPEIHLRTTRLLDLAPATLEL